MDKILSTINYCRAAQHLKIKVVNKVELTNSVDPTEDVHKEPFHPDLNDLPSTL